MRQKPAKEEAIAKQQSFLYALFNQSFNQEGANFSTAHWIKDCEVSKSSGTVATKLGFITRDRKNNFTWVHPTAPTRQMALAMLDELLHKNKKQLHVPLMPELATAIRLLSSVSEKMNNLLVQQEVVLKRFKIANSEPAILSETLFSEEQQERQDFIDLLKAVTTGHYANYDFVTPYPNVNDTIINATQDLFTKYINLKSIKNVSNKFKNSPLDQVDTLQG